MCTVTIVPYHDGFRLVCNRDEQRDRRAATPPAVHRLQHGTAIYPVDPVGGGTWIGVNDAGLAAALLNRTIDSAVLPGCTPLRSRGLIIPNLLGCRSLTDALEIAEGLDPAQFDLFRLVLVQRMAAVVLTSDGLALSVQTMSLSRPLMLTSSSLGDAVVEAPRRRLFERLVLKNDGAWLAAQTRFHAHQWRSCADISVTMERQAARTVSRTWISVTSHASELCYDALGSAKPLMVRVV
jgi:uncharacterized protein with NRDE domain